MRKLATRIRSESMYINEILTKENRCPCEGVFWVKSRTYPSYFPARGGGWKFDLIIGDRTGEIRLTYFEDDEATIHAKFDSIPKNSIIKVDGSVNIWSGRTAINVGGYSGGSLEIAAVGDYDISQFIPVSDREDLDTLFADIQSTVAEMAEGPLKVLLNLFMDDPVFVADFKTNPGAKYYHHAWKGGLLEHTWEVLSHCKSTIQVHGSLNKDLVYAGAILHDIGKMREMRIAEGIISTEEGDLLGHLYLTLEMVNERIIQGMIDFPSDIKNRLFHILLSHHKKLEHGSPVETMTPEAITVACADEIGSQVSQYIRAIKDAKTDENKFWVRPIGWVYKE